MPQNKHPGFQKCRKKSLLQHHRLQKKKKKKKRAFVAFLTLPVVMAQDDAKRQFEQKEGKSESIVATTDHDYKTGRT